MVNKGIGTTIAMGAQLIGVLTGIKPPEKTADRFETTTLDTADSYKTFAVSLKDGGEPTLKGYFDFTDGGQAALDAAFDAMTAQSFTITWPSGMGSPTCTFDAIITKVAPGESNLTDAIGFEITLKVTGKPNFNVSASTGMSALTFVQTDGSTALTAAALTPSFAIGTFEYGFTFTTQTSFKVKPTAASHTIKVYVDGVFQETVSSGSAGTAIAIGAAATKRITIVVNESGKSPKIYNISVSRLS